MLGLEPRPPPSPLARVKMKPGEGPPGSPALVQAGFSFRQGLFFFFFRQGFWFGFFFRQGFGCFFFRHGSFTGRGFQQSRPCVLQHSGFFTLGLEAAGFYPPSPTPKSTPKAGICKLGRGGSRSGGGGGGFW